MIEQLRWLMLSRAGGLGIKVRNKNEVETRALKKTCIFRMKKSLPFLLFPKIRYNFAGCNMLYCHECPKTLL